INRVNSERVGESFSQRFQRSSVFPFSNPGLLQPWGTRLSTMSTLKELENRLANVFSVRASFLFQTQVAATLGNSIMNRVNSERVGESFSQRFQRSNVFPFSNPGLSPTLGNSTINRVNSERVGESFSQRFQRSSVFPFSNPGLLQPCGARL